MTRAGHHTMMGGAALCSVEFTRGGGLDTPLYSSAVFSEIPSAWTISLWAKAASASEYGGFFKIGNQTPGSGVGLGFGNSTFEVNNAGTNLIALREAYAWDVCGDVSPINTWHYYAITVNGTTLIAYRDGSTVSTKTGTIGRTGVCDIAIGVGAAVSPLPNEKRLFAGNITRLALWSRNLSASEVATDFADGNAAPSVTNGLEHFWPLSSAGNFLSDLVGDAALTIGSAGVALSPDVPKLSTGGGRLWLLLCRSSRARRSLERRAA